MTSKITNIEYSNLKPSTGYRRLYIQNRATMWYEWTEYNLPTNTPCCSPPRGQTNFLKIYPSNRIHKNWDRLSIYPELTTRTHTAHQIQTSIQPNSSSYTVEPHHKEVGYNKTLPQQGNPAGPSPLHFPVSVPWHNEKPDTTRQPPWSHARTPVTTRLHCNFNTWHTSDTQIILNSESNISRHSPYTYRYRKKQ